MIDKISMGDENHSLEHKSIMEFLEDKHDNNNKQHEKMIGMIKENTDNIKLTHTSILELNKEIKLHHST
jgi:hypothetical protein